jgi:hypothetical protein
MMLQCSRSDFAQGPLQGTADVNRSYRRPCALKGINVEKTDEAVLFPRRVQPCRSHRAA